jgi:hypothetical protein
MGPGRRPIPGRYLRVAGDSDYLYLQMILLAYAIRFPRSALDRPGVSFGPACVPSPTNMDVVNAFAKSPTDLTIGINDMPAIPNGTFMPFCRLPQSWSLRTLKQSEAGGAVGGVAALSSKMGMDHPILRGERVFAPLKPPPVQPGKKADPQSTEGSVGYLCFSMKHEPALLRLEHERWPFGHQELPLYLRFVFSDKCLDTTERQIKAIEAALDFAGSNTPTDKNGNPWVTFAKTISVTDHKTVGGRKVTKTKVQPYSRLFEVDPSKLGSELESRSVINIIEDTWQEAVNIMVRDMCIEKGMTPKAAKKEAVLIRCLVKLVARKMGEVRRRSADATEEQIAAVLYSEPYTASLEFEDEDDDDDECADEDEDEYASDAGEDGKIITKTFTGLEAMQAVAKYNAAMELAAYRKKIMACSPILNDMGPPDPEKFGSCRVLIYSVMLDVRLVYTASTPEAELPDRLQACGNLITRFMWDAMIENPSLSVVSADTLTRLSLFTDKAPGLLGVKTMQDSVPSVKTNTSDQRQMKRFSQALPRDFVIETVDVKPKPLRIGDIPRLTREEANQNLLLANVVKGEDVLSQVPGCLGSVYVEGTKCCVTIASGTGHSWPCLGAHNWYRAVTPWSTQYPYGWFEESVNRDLIVKSLQALCPPLFNATVNQVWARDGFWTQPEAYRRADTKAYGMDPNLTHSVFGWCLYPAWPQDAQSPKAFRIWDLKYFAEATMQWNLRYGRVLRQLLTNHKRKIRDDIANVIFPNYYYSTEKRQLDKLAPVAKACVSVYNAYKDNVELGTQCPRPTDDIGDDDLDDDLEEEPDESEVLEDAGEYEDGEAGDMARLAASCGIKRGAKSGSGSGSKIRTVGKRKTVLVTPKRKYKKREVTPEMLEQRALARAKKAAEKAAAKLVLGGLQPSATATAASKKKKTGASANPFHSDVDIVGLLATMPMPGTSVLNCAAKPVLPVQGEEADEPHADDEDDDDDDDAFARELMCAVQSSATVPLPGSL